MQKQTYDRLDLPALKALAAEFARGLKTGDVVLLKGDLGAGKTQFARYVIQAATGAEIDVPSPTFTLVQTYETECGDIWHFDLYRLEDEDEIEAVGFDEARAEGITLIEWPDRLGRYLPARCIEIELTINDDETRTLTLTKVNNAKD